MPTLAIRLASIMLLNDPAKTIPLIAHRGESHDAPENTLASFALAWERNDDAIELDVHLTSDGQLIVCHDADTKRTTGEDLLIKDQPLAKLKALDAGTWKDPTWAGTRLPTLDEVIAQMPQRKRVFVEIKTGPEAVEPLAKVIDKHHRPTREIVIISFHLDSVRAAKNRLPNHEVYHLVAQKQDKQNGQWSPTTAQMIAEAKAAGADGLNIAANKCADAELVRQVHDAGLKLLVWTVDDPALAWQLAGFGVDAITTNRAAWLKQQLHSDAMK